MPELSICPTNPPGRKMRHRSGKNNRYTKNDARSRAADAWSSAGISIKPPRQPDKSLEIMFQQPILKVDITTGAVLACRWPLAENVICSD